MSNLKTNKTFHYVYLTTNIVNGKQYLGKHSTENLEDGYIGCGVYKQFNARKTKGFHGAVKKYGYESFNRIILSFHETPEEAYTEEGRLGKMWDVRNNPDFYNLKDCGEGGVYIFTQVDRNKSSVSHLGNIPWNKDLKYSEERVAHMLIGRTGRPNKHKGMKMPEWCGRPQSEHKIQKLREASTGKVLSQETRDKIIITRKRNRGDKPIVLSEEHKKHIGLSNKGKISHKREKVNQLDLDGNIIKVWESISSIRVHYNNHIVFKILSSQRKNKVFDNSLWELVVQKKSD